MVVDAAVHLGLPRLPGCQGGELLAAGTTPRHAALCRHVGGPQVHLSADGVSFSAEMGAVQIYGFGSDTEGEIKDRQMNLFCELGH